VAAGLGSRLRTIRGRVLRISKLHSVNKGAGKLFNSGAYPQGTYGFQAYGMDPASLANLRAMASNAVTSQCHGQCATTAIWLHLGLYHDPAVKVPLEQIKMWFYLLKQQDRTEISRAWWQAKAEILTAHRKWSVVRGPMGATIATLDEAGWNPVSPYQWVMPNGDLWIIKEGVSLVPLLYDFKDTLKQGIWHKASSHHLGKGLEAGADITVGQRHMVGLLKGQQNSRASKLTLSMCGGIWSQHRKFEAGLIDDPVCHMCGARVQSCFHLVWGCPAHKNSENEVIKRTQRLLRRASQGHEDVPCYWLRGITPQAWTHRCTCGGEVNLDESACCTKCGRKEPIGPAQTWEFRDTAKVHKEGIYFLDGSGGEYYTDFRIRAVGWAWTQLELNSDEPGAKGPLWEFPCGYHQCRAQYGTIECHQSVPRAELTALLRLLQHLNRGVLDSDVVLGGAATIYTDHKNVYTGLNGSWLHKQQSMQYGPLG